ncbi:MAG: ATP-binding protein [Desulfobacterales bacterium]
MKKRKIIWQIYPTYLLILFISLIAVSWGAFHSFKGFYLTQTSQDLESRARIFQPQIMAYLLQNAPEKIDAICEKVGEASATRLTVILPNGRVVGDSDEEPDRMDLHSTREEILAARKGEVGKSVRFSTTLEQNMMYVAIPLFFDENIIGVLRTAIPIEDVDMEIREVWLKLAFSGAVIAVILAGISLLAARRFSRPIREMKDVADRFAEGDLTRRAGEYDTEELAGLSDAMNRMAKELNNRINTIIRQKNELETVLSSMMEGVVAVDGDEKIININASAAAMLDIDPEFCKGRSIQETVRNVSFQRLVSKALSQAKVVSTDIVLYNGEERILKVHSSPIVDAAGKKLGTLIVMDDVSRLRRLENVRRDFVANVSHEIKTPLTAIKGFVETLQHDLADSGKEDSKRFLMIILKHVDRLNAIVEDLLSLSKIEGDKNGKIINRRRSDIKEILDTAVQVCRPEAEKKNISISMKITSPLVADIDITLFEQAVINILDNAVKYSGENSSVEIEAGEDASDIVVHITDHGIGISKEHLPRLFERFYRVDKARSRKIGGTGLGLSIVKHIVQAHGGKVTAESTLGKGTTFSIRLPKRGVQEFPLPSDPD